ncbi:MAG: amidohydrolase family protein, partial [Hungatella sp.]
MVIDFRSRPPYKSFATGTALFPRKVDQDFKNLRDIPPLNKNSGKMEEEAGIDLSVIYGRKTKTEGYVPNEEIAELLETYPTRFIGFGGLDLSDIGESVRELEQCKKWGFKGISLEPGYEIPAMYFDDERLTPIYEACKSLNMIVSLTSSIFVGPDLSYCDPVHIQHVANRFPNLKLVVDHGCWPYVNGIIGAAFI